MRGFFGVFRAAVLSAAAIAAVSVFCLWLGPQAGEASETGFTVVLPLLAQWSPCGDVCLPNWAYRFIEIDGLPSAAELFLRSFALQLLPCIAICALLEAGRRRLEGALSGEPAAVFFAALLAPVAFLPLLQDLVFGLHLFNVRRIWIARFSFSIAALSVFALQVLLTAVWLRVPRVRSALGRLEDIGGHGAFIGLAAGALVVWAGIGAPAQSPPPNAPNVVVISIDSLRSDHLHSYGYEKPTSPTIDALAAEGVLFAQAVAPSSWTLPSHMSLLTGLDPMEHGVADDFASPLSRNVPTLAEALHEAGYETFGLAAVHYVSGQWGFARGFDEFDDYTIPNLEGPTSEVTFDIVDGWLDDWDRRDRRRPLFLFLHLWDVHYGYAPPPPYDEMFSEEYHGNIDFEDFFRNPAVIESMSPEDYARMYSQYDGEIGYTDSQIARLVDRLRDMGELDDTIFSVSSDHGDEFFEHHWKGHRHTLYDELIHVPWVLRYPKRVPAGEIVERQVRLTDVAPTILGLAGIQPERFGRGVDPLLGGQDLSPVWSGGEIAARPALSHLSNALSRRPGPVYSIRTRDSKLIWDPKGKVPVRLFNILEDAGEQTNLAGKGDERADVLLSTVKQWSERSPGQSAESAPLRLNPAEVQKLKDLGYIQ